MEIMIVMPMISILSVTSLASTTQADLSLFLATNRTVAAFKEFVAKTVA